jgi:putative cell wall-binding protein
VVYEDHGTDIHGDVKVFNIRTKETKTLAGGPRAQYCARIGEGGLVVWQDAGDATNDGMDISGCYLTDGKVFPVASGPGTQHNPSICGRVVVYNDDSAGDSGTPFGYDTLSGTRFRISPDYGEVFYSSADSNGGRVAFVGEKPGSWAVYLARPADLDVVAAADIYDVAAAHSKASFPSGAGTVVVTTTSSWRYPLISQAAMGTSAPVLLTGGSSLRGETAAELRRLKPTRVVIVGGTSAVGAATQNQIASIVGSGAVTRIGATSARGTALGVVAARAKRGRWNGKILVVSQKQWAGAMTASSVSAARSYPMVLVGDSGFSKSELRRLKKYGVKRAVIIGGTGSVPARASRQLRRLLGYTRVTRIAGKNRYDTSARVAKWAVKHESMRWNQMGFVSGETVGQSLVAGVAKGRTRSVLLMTDRDYLSSHTAEVLKDHQASVKAADFIGNTSAVSRKVRRQVRLITR